VSRLRTPAQETARGRCDAAEIVEEVVATAATTAPQGTSLSALTGGAALAAVDADQLRRVVQNLVENAIKYSPDGGDVVVACASDGDGTVRIDVADEGIGIPPDQRDAIFEKFSRLDPQMGRGIGGTGLGLYICRELVRQMGGTIIVGDNPRGRGSVFTVRLPKPETEGT
jgi:two-component system phosphate regulon sensor histidine kinase PhoR